MCQSLVTRILVLVSYMVFSVSTSDMFHVKSMTTFRPDQVSDYFGYSVSLSNLGLHVGAPKAKSRTVKGIAPGLVFSCPLTDVDSSNASCDPLGKNDSSNHLMRSYIPNDFYKDDMWFGAVIAVVPKDKLLICAPREMAPYKDKHILINGVCYIRGKNKEQGLYPLRDEHRQAYRTDGARKEYGEYGYHLNYFAYGQAGMSVAVTKNSSIIIGAPGVLQWTGTIVDFKISSNMFYFTKVPTMNPYHTLALGPDDYFGYSVESGVFEETGIILNVAGAPRSGKGYGQVLLFEPTTRETDPLKIKAKLIGPQLGSYFGASLCAVDIDGDGLSDLLVGAPNYAKRDGIIKYDQGAVFVYMSRKEDFRFVLSESGHVMGSRQSGARFGTTIADLGDVDSDGFNDVVIGAPWEDNGAGAVYIYRGSEDGLRAQYTQRIHAEGAKSFGIAVSKGYDVDNNECNDIAVGAHNSGTVHLYRSVPTIQVLSSIKVPDAKDMKQNATHFSALFCVTVPRTRSSTDSEIEMKATILVDPEGNRANTLGEADYVIKVRSGFDTCDEQIIEVKNQSDLSKPILLKFNLEPVNRIDDLVKFPRKMARVSGDSILHSSVLIQMLSDCGDDLVCTPWLEMTVEPLVSPFVPGADTKLGLKITVINKEEPAYSVKLSVTLPCPPRRLLELCSLQDLVMTCDLPAPLKRNETAVWEVELEYAWDGTDEKLKVTAELQDPQYMRNVSEGPKELVIPIAPKSNFVLRGKSQPNITITRDAFEKNTDVLFTHYFEITNEGPSDFYHVKAVAYLPEEAILTDSIEGATLEDNVLKFNVEKLRAKTTNTYFLLLKYDIYKFGNQLEETLTMNVTSKVDIYLQHYHASETYNASSNVTTTLFLEPKTPIWPLIVGLVAGLLLLAIIILALYKFGFFSRKKKEELKHLLSSQEDPSSSSSPSTNDPNVSSQELLDSDTD
ncbi:unnamed protein product [Chilo suppressalis]|uniref:Integrin alpha second immunoglobulin-like domain-containing protein n=1 Tax=Chilo suppressalis TaxID=168631 RepID=A0ABN8LH56_CHISP|nr:unnamed protein product [Chilo suppressalis]